METGVGETGVWIQLSLSIEYLETDVKVSNVTCTYGEKVSGYKCPDNWVTGDPHPSEYMNFNKVVYDLIHSRWPLAALHPSR